MQSPSNLPEPGALNPAGTTSGAPSAGAGANRSSSAPPPPPADASHKTPPRAGAVPRVVKPVRPDFDVEALFADEDAPAAVSISTPAERKSDPGQLPDLQPLAAGRKDTPRSALAIVTEAQREAERIAAEAANRPNEPGAAPPSASSPLNDSIPWLKPDDAPRAQSPWLGPDSGAQSKNSVSASLFGASNAPEAGASSHHKDERPSAAPKTWWGARAFSKKRDAAHSETAQPAVEAVASKDGAPPLDEALQPMRVVQGEAAKASLEAASDAAAAASESRHAGLGGAPELGSPLDRSAQQVEAPKTWWRAFSRKRASARGESASRTADPRASSERVASEAGVAASESDGSSEIDETSKPGSAGSEGSTSAAFEGARPVSAGAEGAKPSSLMAEAAKSPSQPPAGASANLLPHNTQPFVDEGPTLSWGARGEALAIALSRKSEDAAEGDLSAHDALAEEAARPSEPGRRRAITPSGEATPRAVHTITTEAPSFVQIKVANAAKLAEATEVERSSSVSPRPAESPYAASDDFLDELVPDPVGTASAAGDSDPPPDPPAEAPLAGASFHPIPKRRRSLQLVAAGAVLLLIAVGVKLSRPNPPAASAGDPIAAPAPAAPVAPADVPGAQPEDKSVETQVVALAGQLPAAADAPANEAQPDSEQAPKAEPSSEASAAASTDKAQPGAAGTLTAVEAGKPYLRNAGTEPGGVVSYRARKLPEVDYKGKAREYYSAGKYREAAEAYQRASQRAPSDAGAFAGLGASWLSAGEADRAIMAYQRAVQLKPDVSGFQAALGRAYLTKGDKGRAAAAYTKALALDPQNQAAKSGLATLR